MHDGAVLGFGLGVVVAVPGARFRLLFDEQFIESFRDTFVDIFGAVIAVEAVNDEGEAQQQRFEHREEECLADFLMEQLAI